MRDESLRWGLGMGAVAAILGTAALILGALIEPVKRVTTAEAAALAIFIRGIFVLVTLGIALGLAYYAGLRAERARLSADASLEASSPSVAGSQNQRSVAVLAGGLTMFCYWLITSLYMLVLPPSTQPPTAQVDLLSFVENRLLFGIIFVLFGLGLGGLGGKAPAAQLLLDRIVRAPLPAAATVSVATPSQEEAEPASVAAPAVREPGTELGPVTAEPEQVIAEERAASPVDASGASNQSA